jgi:hypothetical protein
MTGLSEFIVRLYEPRDRQAVRALCCDTGFLGSPIDPVFQDRDLFADFFTDYYLRCEPDSAFVVETEAGLQGYLLGARYPLRHQLFSIRQAPFLAAKVLTRFWRYNRATRNYLGWILRNSRKEVPPAPRQIGHFHVNLLPHVRSVRICRELLNTYLAFLYGAGVKRISAQFVTFEDRRSVQLLERYGFRVLNQSRITKFRQYTDKPVYLSTIVKDLSLHADGRALYPTREQKPISSYRG